MAFSWFFRGFSVAFSWPSFWANFTRTRPGKVFWLKSLAIWPSKMCGLGFLAYFWAKDHECQYRANVGNEKRARTFFWHKLLEHPQGSGTSRQNSRDIPDSSLRNPRKTNFRGRARSFRPPPLRVEDFHPTGRSPDPKVNLCALLSCLKMDAEGLGRKLLLTQRARRSKKINPDLPWAPKTLGAYATQRTQPY